jgi:AraC-like DNA-binding protein
MEYRPYIHSAGTVILKGRGSKDAVRMVSYQLNQLHQGAMALRLEGQETCLLGPGDAWLVPPDRSVQVTITGAPAETTWIHFSVDQNPAWHGVDPKMSFTGAHVTRPEMRQTPPEKVWGVRMQGIVPHNVLTSMGLDLREVAARWCKATRIATLSANVELERLFLFWVEQAGNRAGAKPTSAATTAERIRRSEVAAWQYIGANFGVKEMARLANLSRAHFSRAYRQLRGQPVRDTLNHMRITEAKRLLSETAMTVSDVAARLNYSTPMSFERMFKSSTGQTPSTWRREHRRPTN